MNIDTAKLKSCVERIGRLLDEREGLAADVRDIYTEAKSANIVPKVLRKVIARRRAKDPAALILEDDLLDTYLASLDGPTKRAVEMAAAGASARKIEAETGIDQATVARSVSLKKKRETKSESHSPALAGSDLGKSIAQDAEPVLPAGNEGRAGKREPLYTNGYYARRIAAGEREPGHPVAVPQNAGAGDTRPKGSPIPEIDTTIPQFLRRSHA